MAKIGYNEAMPKKGRYVRDDMPAEHIRSKNIQYSEQEYCPCKVTGISGCSEPDKDTGNWKDGPGLQKTQTSSGDLPLIRPLRE